MSETLLSHSTMLTKIVSSLEKCYPDENIRSKREIKNFSMLKNERASFQMAYCLDPRQKLSMNFRTAELEVDSPIKEFIKLRRVSNVPSLMPIYKDHCDSGMTRTDIGLYPDALLPMDGNRLMVHNHLGSLWIDIEGEGLKAGVYPITLRLRRTKANNTMELDPQYEPCEATLTVEVIDALLPKQTTKFTQWFYCDCLQVYYETENFDDKHWLAIENFMKTAVKNGINMILTPLFTPPLDTAPGLERPTTQLIDVTLEKGEYSFGFEKLDKWIALCDKVGVEYFEINHMFTQWGCHNCPKVMATVDGEYRRIFGWDTSATGEEYGRFLRTFIPQFIAHMKEKNCDKRMYFHVSDEPSQKHLDSYKAARDLLYPLVKDYPIIDAMSHVEFFDQGLCQIPVPHNGAVQNFLDRDVKERWTYYCCGSGEGLSNRLMCMPSERNRIIGAQLYKYNVKGFLHWGYNFYFNEYSYAPLNPWNNTDGDGFSPSGDCFSVYPGPRCTCIESLRLKVFYDALQDQRALELCESLYSREFVISLIDEGITPLEFNNYPRDPQYLLNLREKINAAIKAKL